MTVDLTQFSAVIFDFDGVIVDSETLQARAWTQLARGLDRHSPEITAERIAGRLDDELASELFPGCDSARCVDEKARLECGLEAAGELRLVDGAQQLVRNLATSHRLAICSSCRTEAIVRRLKLTGLDSMFQVVAGRTDGVPHKPAPDLYLRVLEQLGISASDACAIEDSLIGVAAAKSAGIYTIQLLHEGMPRAGNADAHVRSLKHLKSRRPWFDRQVPA